MKIEELKFFKGKNLGPVIETGENLIVFLDDTMYRVEVLEKEHHFKHQLIKDSIDDMRKILPSILPVEEVGILGDQSYLIREKISDNKYDMSDDEQRKYGQIFGRFLREYHSLHQEEGNKLWHYLYQDKILHLFHEHGISQVQDVEDYILIDYIRDNAYLINDRKATDILHFDSFQEIKISDEGDFEFEISDHSHIADPYYEFRNLALDHQGIEWFLKGVLEGYFELIPRSFFRISALYLIVDYWGETFLEGAMEEDLVKERKEKIFDLYEYLRSFKPSWYRELEDEV